MWSDQNKHKVPLLVRERGREQGWKWPEKSREEKEPGHSTVGLAQGSFHCWES